MSGATYRVERTGKGRKNGEGTLIGYRHLGVDESDRIAEYILISRNRYNDKKTYYKKNYYQDVFGQGLPPVISTVYRQLSPLVVSTENLRH